MADNLTVNATGAVQPVDESLITYTHVIYALHTLAVLIGITTAHTIVGSFIGGVPSIVAVIMNYARQHAVRGTFLESHFRWQIRTFWFALLWFILVWAVSFPLMFILIGFFIWIAGMVLVGLWIIYRVVRGWLALRERRPMYV